MFLIHKKQALLAVSILCLAGCGMPGPHFNHVAKSENHPYLAKALYSPEIGNIGGPCTLAGLSTLNSERKCRAGEIIETSGPATLYVENAAYHLRDIPFPPSGNMRPEAEFMATGKIHHSNMGGVVMGGLQIANGDQLLNAGNFGGVGTGGIVLGALSVLGSLGGGGSGQYVPGYHYWKFHHALSAVRTYPNYQTAKVAMVKDILWAERVASGKEMDQEGSRMVGENAFWAPGKAFYSVSSSVYGVVFQGEIRNPDVLHKQAMLPVFLWTEDLKPITPKKKYAMTVTWKPVGHEFQNAKWVKSQCQILSEKYGEWSFVTRQSKGEAYLCHSGNCHIEREVNQPVLW